MLIGPLLSDAARPEFPKVTSAHDNHSWLSISYSGGLSQLWQNSPFCDKFCDKTVVQNYINCDKDINISGWRKKMAASRSSEMCRNKEIFSPSKIPSFYLKSFQITLLFPAIRNLHFAVDFCLCRCMFSLIGISNTWTGLDKQMIFFLQPERSLLLNSEILQRIESQASQFQNCERLMRKTCFPRLFFVLLLTRAFSLITLFVRVSRESDFSPGNT